jgi:hypothetical protein
MLPDATLQVPASLMTLLSFFTPLFTGVSWFWGGVTGVVLRACFPLSRVMEPPVIKSWMSVLACLRILVRK